MKNRLKNKYLLLIIILVSVSCKKFTEVGMPDDKIVTSAVFTDEVTATSAILGIYARLAGVTGPPFSNGAVTLYTGLLADELETTLTDLSTMNFSAGNLSASSGIVYTNFWRFAYEPIYQTNMCIEGLESSTTLPPAVQNQLLGEAYFLRAFCYWYLVNLFGDVPLITTSDYVQNAKIPRTSSDKIIANIITDLNEAKDLLLPKYPTNSRLRVNYYTVLALLSRTYLYNEDWETAKKITTEVIDYEKYELEQDLSKVFLAESQEAIWQLSTENGTYNTLEGQRFIPTSSATTRPQYPINPILYESFNTIDKRKSEWIKSKTVAGTTYNYPFKYKVRLNANRTEYYIVFRLTEQYMIRAEARARLNDLSNAIKDLDLIRSRAGLPLVSEINPQISQSDLLDTIFNERRFEFFAEWGHRWFDLKRAEQINEVLTAIKPEWKSTNVLFPIPNSEILVNKNLKQNPGY